MKPQKLIMSAFGSYAGEAVVDFTNKNHGIFLITGDTGAGKTTIFDAICYALYDRTSGGAREGADMRSQYADADTPTFVEYTFTYGSDTYVIKRNPKYSRLSRRKDKDGNYKETIEQPGVELIMPDGRVFPGKLKETNEKIIEIIGLDADQFSQIAMIAQGEFMRLLQAPSNKRKEIFSKIFNTKIYWQLQEELKRRAKSIFGELEDNRRLCEQELGSIRALPEQMEAEAFIFQEHDLEGILQRLNGLLEVGRKKECELKEQIKKGQKQIEEKSSSLMAARQNNELFEQLDAARTEKKLLEDSQPEMLAKEKLLEQAKKATVVKTEEKKYQTGKKTLAECLERLASYEKEKQQLQEKLQMLEEKKTVVLQCRQEKEPEYQQQILRIQDSLPLYEQAQQVEQELKTSEKKLQETEHSCVQKQADVVGLQKELLQMHEKQAAALLVYQDVNDAFIAEQAGILASTLQDGKPCPVCGSTSHPDKARLSDRAVTQQEVNKAKLCWQKAEEEERKCSEKVTKAREEQESAKQELQEQRHRKETLETQYRQLKQQMTFTNRQEAQKELEKVQAEMQELLDNVNRIEQDWQMSTKEWAALAGKTEAETEQKKRLEKEAAELQEHYKQTLIQQGFPSEEAYRDCVCEEKQIQIWEQEKAQYHDHCVRTEANLQQLEQQTAGRERIDTVVLAEVLSSLQQERNQLEESNREIYGINQRNEEANTKLKKYFSLREKLKKQYQLYSVLDKTANGNLAGTAKLDFQTYIQRRFFEMMIREANKRLIKMSSNQFILLCRSLDKLSSQGAVGLDLDVYSLVNDRTRDVKTLSGGESFMAALAMALGMSDVIQNTAGRVKLDTMFVDEGFGSLDDEARAQAMQILQELAADTRLVGIISHVTELKEQIDCKLMVHKDEKGSNVFWVEN